MQLAPEQLTASLAFYAWKASELEALLGNAQRSMDGLAARNKELEGQMLALTQVKTLYPESKPLSDLPVIVDSEGGEPV